MSELQKSLEQLTLRLDRMALRAEQSVKDALHAVIEDDVDAGRKIADSDSVMDREEVEIEQEAIRLLALFQPTAVDLRTICFIIKANSDLERIADKAASMGRRVKHFAADNIRVRQVPGFVALMDGTLAILTKTVSMLGTRDLETARSIIPSDQDVNQSYKAFVRGVLDSARSQERSVDVALSLILLARSLERIGDLCTNIAEDVVYLCTGDIVRHPAAMAEARKP